MTERGEELDRIKRASKPRSVDQLVAALEVGDAILQKFNQFYSETRDPHWEEEAQRLSAGAGGLYFALNVGIRSAFDTITELGVDGYMDMVKEFWLRPENQGKVTLPKEFTKL